MLVSIDTMAAVLLLFAVVRVGRLVNMERWFLGGLTFWLPPNSDEVAELLNTRDGLLKRGGLPGNRKKASAKAKGSKGTSLADLQDLRKRVFIALRRHADQTFSPGFQVPQRNGKASPADLRDAFYYNSFSTLFSLATYAALIFAASTFADLVVGLPRFWSVLFASVVLLCMAIYYLYGWMTIVDRSSLQFRGSIIVAVVATLLAMIALLAVPGKYLDFGIDSAIKSSSERLKAVAGELTDGSSAPEDGASVDEENGDADTVEALNALVPGMRSNLWIKTVLALLAGTLSFVLFAPLFRFARHSNFVWQNTNLGIFGSLLWTADVLGPVVLCLLMIKPLALLSMIPTLEGVPRETMASTVWLTLVALWGVLHLALMRQRLQIVLSRAPSNGFCELVFQVIRADIESIKKTRKSLKNAEQARKKHESTEKVHAQLTELVAQRYNETYSQICVAALQYFAPLAILAACWILAYHEGPAGSFVADVWRSYVMEPLGYGARINPAPSKVELLLNNLLQQGDAATSEDRKWSMFEGENPIGYAAAGATTQLGAIWELRVQLYQAMAHFLVWWIMASTSVISFVCMAYWSVQDRTGRLYSVVNKVVKTMDAVDASHKKS